MSDDAFDPNDVYRQYVFRGEEWADLKAAYDLKSDLVKVIRAEVFLGAKGAKSAAQAMEIALASKEYRAAIHDAAEAGRLSNRAKVRYDAIQALFEARRTVEATHRAAMRSAT